MLGWQLPRTAEPVFVIAGRFVGRLHSCATGKAIIAGGFVGRLHACAMGKAIIAGGFVGRLSSCATGKAIMLHVDTDEIATFKWISFVSVLFLL